MIKSFKDNTLTFYCESCSLTSEHEIIPGELEFLEEFNAYRNPVIVCPGCPEYGTVINLQIPREQSDDELAYSLMTEEQKQERDAIRQILRAIEKA